MVDEDEDETEQQGSFSRAIYPRLRREASPCHRRIAIVVGRIRRIPK